MSHSETFTSQSAASDLMDSLNSLSSSGFQYKHRDGTLEFAANAQEVLRLCPVAREYAQEAPHQLVTLFQMAMEGQEIMDKKGKNDLLESENESLQKKTKKSERSDEIYDNDTQLEADLHEVDDMDYDDKRVTEDADSDFEERMLAGESPPEHDEKEGAGTVAAEPREVLEVDEPVYAYEDLSEAQLEAIESGEMELEDLDIDAEPLAVAYQAPEVADDMGNINTSPQEIASSVINYEDEPSIVDSAKAPEAKVDSLTEAQVVPNESFTPPFVEAVESAPSVPNAVAKSEATVDVPVHQAETVIETQDIIDDVVDQNNAVLSVFMPDGNRPPQVMFYQENNQFEPGNQPKPESGPLKIIDTGTSVPLRVLNFQPLEMSQVQPEKIITFDDVRQGVEGKSFEHTLVEVVKFMSIEQDSPEQQQLHKIVSEIKKSLANREMDSDTGKFKRFITPEIYENTLALLRFLGHEEPEEILTQFTEAHGEDFLLDTLDYISQLNEVDENEELFADANTIATYNRLLELTSEKPTLELDSDLENRGVIEVPFEELVLKQIQLNTEVSLEENQSFIEEEVELTADMSVSLFIEEQQEEETEYEFEDTNELANEPLTKLQCDKEEIIVGSSVGEAETLNFNPEVAVPISMILETIQENAEKQPLEQTLAQVAVLLPKIEQTQNEELQEVVGDIKKLLTDNYLGEKVGEGRTAGLPEELIEKIHELVKLLGYTKPEEAIEKCITEYGTDFLLKALSYISEPQDAFKRKTLELSIFTAGSNKKNKPSMEVATGTTSMYVYMPAA